MTPPPGPRVITTGWPHWERAAAVVQAESASTDKAATLASNRRPRNDAPMESLLKARLEPAQKTAPGPHECPCSTPGSFRLCFKLFPLGPADLGQQIWPLRPGFGGLRAGPVACAVAAGRATRILAARPRRFARVLQRQRLVDAQRPHLLGVM